LQALCDSLGPADVQAFFDRWIAAIPTPLSAADRAAGYWWELSMRQVELSRTLVFDDPRRARSFFEALVQDNIGIGRPEEVSIAFAGRQVCKSRRETFGTRIFTAGTDVRIEFRRDGDQQTVGPPRPSPPSQPPSTDRQSPTGQPAVAYDRTSRSEPCHRLCAV
jgi:hypothetical protein